MYYVLKKKPTSSTKLAFASFIRPSNHLKYIDKYLAMNSNQSRVTSLVILSTQCYQTHSQDGMILSIDDVKHQAVLIPIIIPWDTFVSMV